MILGGDLITKCVHTPGTNLCSSCVDSNLYNLQAKENRKLTETLEKLHGPTIEMGRWMAAAIDDSLVCDEMKADIQAWFEAFPEEWRPVIDPGGETVSDIVEGLHRKIIYLEQHLAIRADLIPEPLMKILLARVADWDGRTL